MQYDHKKIEKKWQKKWLEEKIYEPSFDSPKKPFYNLMMFPYPSAEGLHVGNMYAFTGADIYGRMKRMQGNDVFEPIGLDGFGIHSENYAMKVGTHPMDQAEVSEKRFYTQLQSIGNGFAWDEHLETYDPEYYRWTQWIFVQMFKNGLAYRKKQSVNWCPKDQTVLADEQVIAGKCERCGSEVIKKELEQWFFKITDYAERLLKNLEGLDWSEKVKIAQKNWIGKSEGAEIDFLLDFKKNPNDNERRGPNGERAKITVFTTRPDTLFGATYLVLSPEHLWVTLATDDAHDVLSNKEEVRAYIAGAKAKSEMERIKEGGEKTGVELKGVKAVNPVNGEEIPIFIADYVLSGYGTGAIMAVPAHDERDFEFAKKFKLDIRATIIPNNQEVSVLVSGVNKQYKVTELKNDLNYKSIISGISKSLIQSPTTNNGILINSGKFDGMDSEQAKWEITKFAGGERKTQFRLRDWLISRQRYWGPPIPMIFCEACAVKGIGGHASSSGKASEGTAGWYAVAETELPVLLPRIKDFRPTGSGVSPLAVEKSFYETKCPKCGGAARRETDVSDTFLDSAWYYLRYLDTQNGKSALNEERVKKWLPAAMYTGGAEHSVLHLLYVRFVTMALHDWKLVDFEEPFKKFRAHGLIIKDGAKMSKSKGNVINPDEFIQNFGADTLRMYLMFLAPFEEGGDFRDAGILGIERFLKRVWKCYSEMDNGKSDMEDARELSTLLHKTIKKVTEDIENLHYNTAVSAIMILLNAMEKQESSMSHVASGTFLKLLAPFAPHMTEEIWREVLGHTTSIHKALWPEYDPALMQEAKFTLVFQVNGKVRDSVEAASDISEADAMHLALQSEKVKQFLAGKEPKKTIYVPKKLVNIVV